MCGKKKSRRDRGDRWRWNDKAKDTIARKKVAFTELCRFSSEDNKTQYKRLRNQTRKVEKSKRVTRKESKQELRNFLQF